MPPTRGRIGGGGDDLFGAAGPPGSERPDARSAPHEGAWSVSEVIASVRESLDRVLGQLWIKGEIGEIKTHRNGHWYFTLKDAAAQIRCVMWQTYTQRASAPPAAGTEVYVLARPTVWAERGEVRFSAVTLLPTAGVGARQLAFLRAKEALARDGLLDPARKRALPKFPRVIAIVTSLDGAALHDMITVARRRWPALRVLVLGSAVQGAAAEPELVRALDTVNRLPADLCVLGRGGGSREDLSAFDAEAVCRAVAAVRVPVIAAVGHENDLSLVDLVADLRAPTPSAAMELALPDRQEVLARVGTLGDRMARGLRRRTRLVAERLQRSDDRLQHVLSRRLALLREQVGVLGARLHALSPLQTLERGFAVARDARGRILKRTRELPPGLPFRLRVSDGEVGARVEPA